MAVFGDTKTVKQVKKPPPAGYYSLPKEELSWENCRERFARTFTSDLDGFYFSHKENEGKRIAHFIEKTEDVLNLEEFTSYSETNLKFALWVKPCFFWRECVLRRSLFTILLRCGRNYNIDLDNYEEALYGNGYMTETKDAVRRFLFGFTDYVADGTCLEGIGNGWVAYFQNQPVEFVRAKLVRKEPEDCLIAAGTLWG